jgi:SAM-dependent methyltransferase
MIGVFTRESSLVWVIWAAIAVVAVGAGFSLAWRWGSRRRSLPCPTLLAWSLDNPVLQRLNGTRTILERMPIQPGQKVLEIGPGPGRLLIRAAQRVGPAGEAVGIDIQRGMIERLKSNAARANVTNLTAIVGDATQPHVPDASFDLVFLCTVLGEVPDRGAALTQAFRALKPGGTLSVTEMIGDPHYQSRSTVQRLAEEAGFRPQSIQGHWWFYTANFLKP